MPPPNSLDHEEQWTAIKQAVTEGLSEALQAQGQTQSIELVGVDIDDRLERHDLASQKQTRLQNKTWGVPVRGRFVIRDPQGQPIREQTIKLMDLPKLTPRHSFILDGTEYQVKNQFRLKPGVYTRVKRNGELESQFNLVRRYGNFRLRMNPETGRYKVQFGTANVDLLPVLDVLGVSPREAQEALGPELWAANATRVKPERDVRKMYRAIFRKKSPDDLEEAAALIRSHLTESRLDPETTQISLGKPFETVTGETVLRAAQKILAINRGEANPDDRDEMRFKQLLTPDDLLRERIVKGSRELSKIKRGIQRRVDQSTDARVIVRPPQVQDLVHGFFNRSMLAEVPKQVNPLEMLSNFAKTTVRGEGGIRERNAVTLEARNLTPTQMGFIDPVHTPESAEIGVTNHLAVGVSKRGERITTRVTDARTGRQVDLDPVELFEATVGFPDQYRRVEGRLVPAADRVKAMRAGEPVMVDPAEVEYVLASPIGLFDLSVNLLPFLGSLQGGRAMMAAKMQEQAVSLTDREAPLVQIKVGDQVFEDLVGKAAQVPLAPVAGEVLEVTPANVRIRDDAGEEHTVQLYENFPLNAKSFLHSEPLVAPGDRIEEGQAVADSPFTRGGMLALGKNLTTAYLPYKGWNHEDGIVISETAARKLTSQHLYQKTIPILKNTVLNLGQFVAYFPARHEPAHLAVLDDDGVVKEGTVLERGMPIAAYMARIEVTPDEAIAGKLGRSLVKPYRDRSMIWEEDVSGTVAEVHKAAKTVQILIRSEEPAVVGDKIAARHANKGIITRILPDNEMPHFEDGTPTEVLLAPTIVPSRINPSQILEVAAAKAAAAQGMPFLAEAFNPESESNITDVQQAMTSAGVTDKEILIDPQTGKPLGQPVTVGPLYTMKLDHPVREKFSARGTGPAFGYTRDETPARGEGKSGQSIDHLTLYSLMAHGARANLREMGQIKGGRNDEWWRAWMARDVLPTPQRGLPFERFESLMKGMGVNLERKGSAVQLTPMTDKETLALSRGELQHGRMLMGKNLRPEKGGLFDPDVTGGHAGEGWSHISLSSAIPHPVFENALRTLLGTTKAQYEDIVSGARSVDPETGEVLPAGEGVHGGEAIAAMLERVDVDGEIASLTEQAPVAKATALNKINRKLRFLKNYKELGLKPQDLVMSKLPVIPPRFRPVYPLDSGDLVTTTVNNLYQDAIVINQRLRDLEKAGAPPERLTEKRNDLYQASKAIMSLGNPVSYANLQAQGIFDTIKGKTRAKGGLFQSRILKRRQDLTGRSTMTLDPALNVDEVGMPEEMAWTTFEPFIVRDLVGLGWKPLDAKAEVKQRSHTARNALDRVVADRLVLVNRSPSLHKHAVVALKPQLTPGKSISMHPLNLKGLSVSLNGITIWCWKGEIRSGTFADLVHDVFGVPAEAAAEKCKQVERLWVPALVDGEIDWQGVTAVSLHTGHERCYRVRTHNGRSVVASEDHSFMVFDPSHIKATALPTIELRPGMLVPRIRQFAVRPASHLLDLSLEPWFTKPYPRGFCDKPARPPASVIPKRLELTREAGFFFGYFLGDGSVTGGQKDTISLATVDTDLQRYLARLVQQLFGSKTWIGSKNSVRFSAAPLGRFLMDQFGHGSANKRIPGFVFDSPWGFRQGFLAGLIMAEGSIGRSDPQLRIEMTSRVAIEQIGLLLATLGIEHTFVAGKPKDWQPGHARTYRIRIVNRDLQLLPELLGDKEVQRQRAVHMHEGRQRRQEYCDLVPFPLQVFEALMRRGKELRHSKEAREERDLNVDPHIKPLRSGSTAGGLKRHAEQGWMSWHFAQRVRSFYGPFNDPVLTSWEQLACSQTISWDRIENVEEVEREEILIDLTVPGSQTFLSSEVFVHNSGDIDGDTVALHVPVTEAALDEARERMLPSRNILSISEDLLLAPSQDMQAGLYLMTKGLVEKDVSFDSESQAFEAYQAGDIRVDDIIEVDGDETTVGRIMVNRTLPPALRDPGLVLDKGTTHQILSDLARNNPQEAPGVIDAFKDLGRQFSYQLGFTVGVNDLSMDLDRRDAILADADREANELPADLSAEDRNRQLVEIYQNAQGRLEADMKEDLLEAGNAFGIMAQSGARGNWGQVRQIAAAPVLYTNALGQTIPQPVRKGFGEGLDMADYWTSLYGARRGHIERSVQTAEPGALNKSLIGTTIHTTVASEDCGTSRGLTVGIKDPRAPGRYLAQPAGPFVAGERLTGDLLARLEREGADQVTIRSPIYCEDPNGVCQKCWGHDSNGQVLDVGHPVGVMSAQAITEPLTQMSMSSFHTGGASKRDADLSDNFTAIKQLLELPQTFRGKATLAKRPGTITSIEPGVAGGHHVMVGDEGHFVPPARDLRPGIEVGAGVIKGQRLSYGLKDPAELMRLKGPYAAREYVAEALDEIYRNSKKQIPARHFETVARSILNSTRVLTGDTGFVPGDISSLDTVHAENLLPELVQEMAIDEALGAALAEEIPGIERGKILDDDDLEHIAQLGYERLAGNPEPVVHEPVAKGIAVLPRTRRDWLSHLAFRNLNDVIERGVPEGWKSEVVTQKPLPPWLYGTL